MVRRLPLGQSVKMVLAWLLIFAAAFVAFTLKDDFLALGHRAMAELTRRQCRRDQRRRDPHPPRRRRPFLGQWRGQRPAGALPGRQRRHRHHARAATPPRASASRRTTASASWSTPPTAPPWSIAARAERLRVGPIERARPRRPHLAGRRRHQRDRHELPVDLVAPGASRGRHCADGVRGSSRGGPSRLSLYFT